MVIKETTNPYYNATLAGAQMAAEEIGGTAKNYGPTQSSGEAQIDDHQQSRRPPRPGDRGRAERSQRRRAGDEARPAASAPRSSPSTPIRRSTRGRSSSIRRPRDSVGRFGAVKLAEVLGNKGKVAIVSAQPTAANQNAWIAAFRDELSKPKYQDIEIVDEVYGYDNEQKAFDADRRADHQVSGSRRHLRADLPGAAGGRARARVGQQGQGHDQARRHVRAQHHLRVHARRHDPGLLPVGSDQARLRHLLCGQAVLGGQDRRASPAIPSRSRPATSGRAPTRSATTARSSPAIRCSTPRRTTRSTRTSVRPRAWAAACGGAAHAHFGAQNGAYLCRAHEIAQPGCVA